MTTSHKLLQLLVLLLLHCSASGLVVVPATAAAIVSSSAPAAAAAAAAAALRTPAALPRAPQYMRQRPSSSRAGCIVAGQISKIDTREDYEALVAAATAENRVVVIKFYASWCRACKAMAPKFARLVDDWPEIEFHEILFDNNKVAPA